MKVLFAVSNDSISEAIIKRYPKEYKELLSYKNVYYFNAILKEIQKDKSYDRIVISEDLEPFVNNNHDSIDNFIFEHLDKISDEAHDNEGKETSIILICSERRTPGSSILNKLFSIGVYNAIMGNDRNLQELCRLINRPRTKKEAKIYYRIDQATYDPVVENEVNEIEIQNILAHFRKLGKNTERYADSFNNIAAQYTDEQLKIIINVLPIKVKAVLESESPKYQSLMGTISSSNQDSNGDNVESGIKINTIGKGSNINGPIVIPSSVKKVNPRVNPVNTNSETNAKVVTSSRNVVKVQRPAIQNSNIAVTNKVVANKVENTKENVLATEKEGVNMESDAQNKEVVEVKRGRGRPKKIATEPPKPKGKRGRPRKTPIENQNETDLNEVLNQETTSDMVLPGLEDISDEVFANNVEEVTDSSEVLPGLESFDEEEILPGVEEDTEEIDVSSLLADLDNEEDETLPGLDTSDDEVLPGLDVSEDDMFSNLEEPSENAEILPGLDNFSSDESLEIEDKIDDEVLPGLQDNEEETMLPGMGFEDTSDDIDLNETYSNEPIKEENHSIESIKPKVDYSMSNLNSLLSKDKKIVTFLGTTKNGTSFLVNNLALMFSLMGINTAILDMTQNRNSYYIFTDSREELRNIAYTSISKLENGYAEGIKVNKNLTVYTSLPADGNNYENAEPILSTLVQNHSLVLIDCDFDTPPAYFASCQEIYLVQSMDILTIQPLTAFIRDLKFKGAWEPEKARVVINKETKIKCLNNKMIIAGMSRYNGPDMSVMTDLFNRDMVKACSIPFDEKVYAKYLETMATCKLSLSGYSKQFMAKMQILGEMVYPRLNSKKSYSPVDNKNSNVNNDNIFSNNTNNTLNQMKNRY